MKLPQFVQSASDPDALTVNDKCSRRVSAQHPHEVRHHILVYNGEDMIMVYLTIDWIPSIR